MDQLAEIAVRIAKCRRCDGRGIDVTHVAPMQRGVGNLGVFVGLEPGNTEVRNAEAFSGASGKNLLKWLSGAGIAKTREEMFSKFYFTSLLKCKLDNPRDVSRAFGSCSSFLREQISSVNPKIIVTLGVEAARHLLRHGQSFDAIIGKFMEPPKSELFPILPSGVPIFPLPHPSPLSRWHNDPENMTRLYKSLTKLKKMLEG